ncbi:MAG: hypothetical protein JEY79_16260 [Pseudodesulfovibrio sp.]|nr:hypothetical protein [Pseudodesulfovibrio sp.]
MTCPKNTLYETIIKNANCLQEISQAKTKAQRTEVVLRMARELDLPVTEAAVDAFFSDAERELCDQELEQVVGGKTCSGNDVFFVKNNLIVASNDYDVVTGAEGNDTMFGLDGNDYMSGGKHQDWMDGGAGNDTMYGNSFHLAYGDVVNGDKEMTGGHDTMYGGSGNDSMSGQAGDDWMDGGTGDDTVDGGLGNDDMHGGEGDDTVHGRGGNDRVNGGTGNDVVYGGDGNDEVYGGAGNDTVYGGSGNDWMEGGEGNDTMYGGSGNNTITGGAGNDSLSGGFGADIFVFGTGDGSDVIEYFNPAVDKFDFQQGSRDDLNATSQGGNTTFSFGGTTVVLEGVQMTADEIWACQNND